MRYIVPQQMKPGTSGTNAPVHPYPMLVHGPGTASGGYDPKLVHRYLRRREQKLKYCVEQELLQNSELAGQVWLMFTIGGDGKVTRGCARGITSSIETCIDEVTKSIEFPPPPDGKPVEVTYSLDFTAEWPPGSVP